VLTLLAGVAVMTAGQRAHAVTGFTFDGITCMDVYFDNDPPAGLGDAPGPEDNRAVIILSRIEPAGGNTFNITSHAYSGPGDLVPTEPPTITACPSQGDGNSLKTSVAPPYDNPDLTDRPTSLATFTAGSPRKLEWEKCQYEPDLFGPGAGASVLSKFTLVVPGKGLTTNYGHLVAYLDTGGSEGSPVCTTTPNFTTYTTVLVSTARDKNTGVPTAPLKDDWDADNITDWNELGNPPPLSGNGDPFNPSGAVGGIAGLPDVSDAARAAARSSGTDATQVATIAGAIIAGVALLGGTAWYVRRRRTG
jgi:hypothetical protein